MPRSGAAVADGGGGRNSASIISTDTETGFHELTVSGYSGTKGLGVGKCIRSAPFIIGGHYWVIQYFPGGFDAYSADWISIFLELPYQQQAGEEELGSVVIAQFELNLLDQMGEPVPSYTKTTMKYDYSESRSWGYAEYIKRKELEQSPNILNDDTFRISIRVAVIKIRSEDTTTARFAATPPWTDLHRDLGVLLESKQGADVTFRVGREVFAVHRSVLGARSPVFRAELFGSMEEKAMAVQIQIDDMDPFVCTDSLPEVDECDRRAMAQHLLVAADRYRLERLKTICEDMLCVFIDTETMATTLALAEQHGCRRLKEACFRFLKRPGNTYAVMATDGFDHLRRSCPSLHKELLAKVSP